MSLLYIRSPPKLQAAPTGPELTLCTRADESATSLKAGGWKPLPPTPVYVHRWSCWESGTLGDSVEAPCSFPIPYPVYLFYLAVPSLYPFIINQ